VREAVLSIVFAQPRHWPALLDAFESGAVEPSTLAAPMRKRFLESQDEALSTRAKALFESGSPGDRRQVFEDYKSVLELPADAHRGRDVFARNCAQCHRLDGQGFAVGPDLSGVRIQAGETLLMHILIPNREVVPAFVNYVVETDDGQTFSGLVGSESPVAVTLRMAGGREQTFARDQIRSMYSTRLSLMPDEVEKGMARQDLADLIGYLKGADAVSDRTVRLFNGKDINGFYTFLKERGRDNDPKGVFTVHDGVLRISGEEWGVLVTQEEYGNYHLIAEYRWGDVTYPPRADRARNSGILVHGTGRDGGRKGLWLYSFELQVIEGGTGNIFLLGDGSDAFSMTSSAVLGQDGRARFYRPGEPPVTLHGSGRVNWLDCDPDWKDVKGFRGPRDRERPPGEWNRFECIARGDTLTVILNGQVVNRCTQVRPARGRIQLQSEGAEIHFRRLELVRSAH
jgi:putative heme-binding domain-containing protein